MQTECGSLPETGESPVVEALSPSDLYWRNVLTGQRLFERAEEQIRVAAAQSDALQVRRAELRRQVQQLKRIAGQGQPEPADQPLTVEEKEALRLLIEGVVRYHRNKLLEKQNGQGGASDAN